jgi:hypothetical protein
VRVPLPLRVAVRASIGDMQDLNGIARFRISPHTSPALAALPARVVLGRAMDGYPSKTDIAIGAEAPCRRVRPQLPFANVVALLPRILAAHVRELAPNTSHSEITCWYSARCRTIAKPAIGFLYCVLATFNVSAGARNVQVHGQKGAHARGPFRR